MLTGPCRPDGPGGNARAPNRADGRGARRETARLPSAPGARGPRESARDDARARSLGAAPMPPTMRSRRQSARRAHPPRVRTHAAALTRLVPGRNCLTRASSALMVTVRETGEGVPSLPARTRSRKRETWTMPRRSIGVVDVHEAALPRRQETARPHVTQMARSVLMDACAQRTLRARVYLHACARTV